MHTQALGAMATSQQRRKYGAPRHNNQTGAIALIQFCFLLMMLSLHPAQALGTKKRYWRLLSMRVSTRRHQGAAQVLGNKITIKMVLLRSPKFVSCFLR
jgi:hypothetical protein